MVRSSLNIHHKSQHILPQVTYIFDNLSYAGYHLNYICNLNSHLYLNNNSQKVGFVAS